MLQRCLHESDLLVTGTAAIGLHSIAHSRFSCRQPLTFKRPRGSTHSYVNYINRQLVLLSLKYEIDDSVTVTVVLLGDAGRCTLMGGT